MMSGRTPDLPERIGQNDIVAWFRAHLTHALAFAETEAASIARAREYHLARAIERGRCAVGHDLSEPTPTNRLGTAPCGYCTNTKEAMSCR
jgi:hypothetical protein